MRFNSLSKHTSNRKCANHNNEIPYSQCVARLNVEHRLTEHKVWWYVMVIRMECTAFQRMYAIAYKWVGINNNFNNKIMNAVSGYLTIVYLHNIYHLFMLLSSCWPVFRMTVTVPEWYTDRSRKNGHTYKPLWMASQNHTVSKTSMKIQWCSRRFASTVINMPAEKAST